MKRMMKRLGACLMVLSLCGGLMAGCGASKESKENTLYVYNWSEYIPQEVYQDFEKETGIHVVESTFSSNEEMLAKMVAGGTDQYDVIVASQYVIPAMKEKKMIQKIDKSKLQNFKNLTASSVGMEFDPQNEYSIPYMATITLVAANKPMLEDLGVTITSFNDLLDPRLANNIVCPDDCRELVDVALKCQGQDPDTKVQAVIEKSYDWLKQLSPNVKLYDSDTPYTALATNEAAVGLVYNMDAALAISQNPDIELLKMDEPSEISYDSFVLTSGTKKITQAEKFIDYIMQPEVYKKCLESYPCVCLNQEALKIMGEDYLNNPASNVDPAEIERAHVIGDVGSAASYYDDVFARMKN